MKSKDFAEALRQLADVLAAPNPPVPTGSAMRDLASVFEIAPTSTVATLVKRLSARNLQLASETPTLGDIACTLAPLQIFLARHAKGGLLADLRLVEGFLKAHAHAGVKSLVECASHALASPIRVKPEPPPLREDLVARYLRSLEDARSDDPRFMAVYNQLSIDPEIGKLEAVALAKRFAGTPATARAAALKKLLSHHRALLTFKAKSESRDGRSAA